jgi:membrane dipeptidase
VADHLEYMAGKCGKAHVGIASDFGRSSCHVQPRADRVDGMEHGVEGLEDASKYPDLIAEMLARGWTDEEVIGLMGGNLLRVMDEVDEVQLALAGEEASAEVYEERTDIPAVKGAWADYLPDAVRRYLTQNEEK